MTHSSSLSPTRAQLERVVHDRGYIDDHTKVLMVDLTVYNPHEVTATWLRLLKASMVTPSQTMWSRTRCTTN